MRYFDRKYPTILGKTGMKLNFEFGSSPPLATLGQSLGLNAPGGKDVCFGLNDKLHKC